MARYRAILPSRDRFVLHLPKIPPPIVIRSVRRKKQLLLATVRYNRLIDLFMHVAAYSLQTHVRTSVSGMAEVETDEVYFAISSGGNNFAIPVQVKGPSDRISSAQVKRDLALCRKSFPQLVPRPVAVQFVRDESGETIVMFELAESEGDIRVVDEKHYRLVPANQIAPEDLQFPREGG